ncbi:unnamed protein product [Bursaphelenchus okinawaensis]|uniref:Uncharacterized protein n=1 Tax=Bursaphelenchus okinawaensis TaxID=465554 RepID=A0A811KJU7_9BILA|nr:unnamed protein product [Bursaphelenchus okinawaensis]CAG9105192.1 unnamed protein product [Bursaphelenchus okinawaensis]
MVTEKLDLVVLDMTRNTIHNICHIDVQPEKIWEIVLVHILNQKDDVIVNQPTELKLFRIHTGECIHAFTKGCTSPVMSHNLILDATLRQAIWYNETKKRWDIKFYSKPIKLEYYKHVCLPMTNVHSIYNRWREGVIAPMVYVDFSKTNLSFKEFDHRYRIMLKHPPELLRNIKLDGLCKKEQMKLIQDRFNRMIF